MALIDPKSGFCIETRTFHSLRPRVTLPPDTTPLSVTEFVFSSLAAHPPPASAVALVDASTGRSVLFRDFLRLVKTLADSLRVRVGISGGDTAFVLSPNSVEVPILNYALLSLGVAISPSNPAGTAAEISRQMALCKPDVAFATTETAARIASHSSSLRYGLVLLDSPEFESMMTCRESTESDRRAVVRQSDTAAIMYSSGTTGLVKAVALTHRNWISVLAGAMAASGKKATSAPTAWLCGVPYFHVYGFGMSLRTVAMGDTLVTMGPDRRRRFDVSRMVRVIGELRISHVAVAPPVIVAIAKDPSLTDGCDLSSLQVVACGGAPMPMSVIDQLRQRLPNVQLAQAYGLTESSGRVFGTIGLEESRVKGGVGKLMPDFQAKIVDPQNPTINLPPLKPGELCLKGPCVMKGYIGDEEATGSILDSEGWLRTGDLCYINNEGFLFVVDRLKELIKYKGYQVPPAELEHLLQSHADIADAAVVPYPDEEAGQVPMAFVVRRDGGFVSEFDIMDFVAKQVAPYKRIRKLRFIDMIPKNAQGKVVRRELIKLALLPTPSKL